MKLSFLENILYKGALKAEKTSMKVICLLVEIFLITFSIIFLLLFFIKPYLHIFDYAIISALGAFMVFLIIKYQSLIRKLDKEIKKNLNTTPSVAGYKKK